MQLYVALSAAGVWASGCLNRHIMIYTKMELHETGAWLYLGHPYQEQ